MKTPNIISSITVLIILLTIACKRDPKTVPNKGTILAPQNLLDYAYFKVGTWWVYKDSITNKRDSLYVTSASRGTYIITEKDNVGYTGTFEFFSTRYQDTIGKNYIHSFDGTWVDNNGRGSVFWYGEIPGYYQGTGLLMTNKFVKNDITYGKSDGIKGEDLTCMGAIDSISTMFGVYKNIVRFDDTYQFAEWKNRTQVYIGKSIGIVKKVLLDSNHVWILEKYNIIQ
ncbi:MAG: hypothetical protein HYU69_05660 [Bacteroidetes bacterium]|nr:hypothetical protein [Bacteroidota bacterium]